MKITDLKEQEVIHCSSQSELKETLRLAGVNDPADYPWHTYTHYTCYYPWDKTYGNIQNYKNRGFNIYSASSLLKSGLLFEENNRAEVGPADPPLKVNVKHLDLALRMCNVEIHRTLLRRTIDVFLRLQAKGDFSLKDVAELETKWQKGETP